jgi:hypothetical protein
MILRPRLVAWQQEETNAEEITILARQDEADAAPDAPVILSHAGATLK